MEAWRKKNIDSENDSDSLDRRLIVNYFIERHERHDIERHVCVCVDMRNRTPSTREQKELVVIFIY